MAKSINIWYWHGTQNAGDYFTKYIFEHLGYSVQLSDKPELVGCGSVLSAQEVNHCKVWGSGFQNNMQHITNKKLHVLAVRGKLTARQIGMPHIVTGDPGTLASFLYKKKHDKKYKYGLIPHYAEQAFYHTYRNPVVQAINIKTNDIDYLFQCINECEFILSSSLHGIIFAHSFGIPAIHIKHIELDCKHEYKFEDYYSNYNIKYLRKDIPTLNDFNINEFDVLYKYKELFKPTIAEITHTQKQLLSVLPS